METREGMKVLDQVPSDAGQIVQMLVYKDRILLACQYRVYELKEDQMVPVKFLLEPT